MIETRAGFLKLHSPYKDGKFTGEYSRVWMNRSTVHGLAASNGLMGSNTLVYAPAIPAYGRGAFAWECIESIEDILDAIERIDKESSKIRNSYKECIGSLIDGEFDRLDKSATMHQTDTKQKEG